VGADLYRVAQKRDEVRQTMRNIVGIAILALVLAALVPKLSERGKHPDAMAATSSADEAPTTVSAGPRTVSIPRDFHGSFQVGGAIDGRHVEFVVDTGASLVSIPEHEAARLGYHPGSRDYTMRTQTANGIGRAAPIKLDMVEVGGVMVRNVAAAVIPDDALAVNLLGLSFLSRLHRFEYREGRLVLEE
jgi:aspartyl protease family protein